MITINENSRLAEGVRRGDSPAVPAHVYSLEAMPVPQVQIRIRDCRKARSREYMTIPFYKMISRMTVPGGGK